MDKNRLLSTFLHLTSISSPSGNEGLIRDYILQELQRMGLNYDVDKKGNIYGLRKGIGEPLVLAAHLDTVEPASNVNPRVVGNFVKTDGTSVLGADNKAAVTAILETLEATRDIETRPVEFLFTVEEETEGGINSFNTKKIKSKFGLVADTGKPLGSIEMKSPYIADLEIKVSGKSAHSSDPEKAVNAVSAAVNALCKCKWGRINRDTIANIGVIEGGEATNTIPGTIILRGEIRSHKKELLQKTFENIKSTFRKEGERNHSSATFSVDPYCDGYEIRETDKDVSVLVKIMQSLGLRINFEDSFGGSDANVLFSKGIRVINIGDGAQYIHTTKERISVRDLEKLTQIFIEYIKQ